MNDLQIFENGDFGEVRIVEKNGEPWFVLTDILKAMETTTSPSVSRQNIEDVFGKKGVDKHPFKDNVGRVNEPTIINEDAAIYLILNSRKQGVEKLKKDLISKISGVRVLMNALRSFEVPEDLPDMFVYAIMEEDTKNIKIGISKDPEARLKQLQTGNSSKLYLVGYRKAENRFKEEKTLHQKNESLRIHGEWFYNESLNSIAI